MPLLGMVVGVLLFASSVGGNFDSQADTGLHLVRYVGDMDARYLLEMDADIVEPYDGFSLVSISDSDVDFLSGLGFEVEPLSTRSRVGFNGYVFETADGEPALPPSLRISQYPDGVRGYYLVQFIGPIKTSWKQEIEEIGGTVHDFIPDFNFIVSMRTDQRATVESLAFVRWVGIYQPAYKINPALNGATGTVKVNIYTFTDRGTQDIADEIESLGASVLETYELDANGVIWASLDASMMGTMANFYGVKSISPNAGEDYLCNEDATWILETDVTDSRTVMDNGVTGAGELITVQDSELRITHEMFYDTEPIGNTHRKIQDQYVLGGGDLSAGNYHGTHVCGTVLGDAPTWYSWNSYDGQAIEARLIFQDIDPEDDLNGAVSPPANLIDGFTPSYNAGSRVHQNSWGGGTGYTDDALEIDQFTWDNKDYNICFAMGNSGSGANTVSEQPEAKNCISVGGVQNDPNQNNMYGASSRGYTDDGRIKPTVLGVSETTTSADNSGDTAYYDMQGTSMACPDISGQVGQIRQYFNDGYYPTGSSISADGFNPSAALCKAILVNGACEITGTTAYQNDNRYPNGDQGWGRSKLDDALYFDGDSRDLMVGDYDKGFITGSYRDVQVSVASSSQPLEFTMVWTDYPGADGASPALVNDLDLRVTGPTGQYCLGNAYTGYNPGRSAINPTTNPWNGPRTGGYDGLNIVESALLIPSMSFPTGTYTIRMNAYNVPQPRQPYALVVTGAIGNAGPIVQLYTPNGGESLNGGSSYDITWSLTDREDNDATMTVDLWLSTDGGTTYPTLIATGEANDGTYTWTVNNIDTSTARVKIAASDSGGLTSEDWSYEDFTIIASGDAPPSSQCTYAGASPTPNNPINIDWSATDDNGLTQVELFYQFNGGGFGSWPSGTNPASASGTSDSGSWSFDFPDGPGAYDLYTRATDNSAQTEGVPGSPDVTVVYDPPLPYDIDVSAFTAGEWAFVSFPIDIADSVDNVLDDSVYGDGGTTWDYIRWYDNNAKQWMSYSIYKPASMNDLDPVGYANGLWVHLTAIGDGHLTTAIAGYVPGAPSVTLYAGWNLVGYPSMTPATALSSLPGQADVVAIHDPNPYQILDVTDLSAVTMVDGEAYWVHVTSTCTWTP